MPDRLRRLRESEAAKDREELHTVAHSIAGISGNLGANKMMYIARNLQTLAQVERWELLGTFIDQLQTEFPHVREQLATMAKDTAGV